ncbi:hypothetical protein RA2_00536 [Roseovarius sp. A-2]|uniref:hypothetical protein n=1 Tax=Roseovarius sp. A-2 TaxID=1570360 RepID=UPI0009B58966|nr:hypothetical protein [Roseovarius sp. A-2]GAW33498.1 hypothetical protein RA2_00536 [Roseovarius sp. A-2]
MTYSSHTSHSAPVAASIARAVLAPLRAVNFFFQSIIDANRMMRDVEQLSRLSDAKLTAMGLTRDEIVPHLAQQYGLRSSL